MELLLAAALICVSAFAVRNYLAARDDRKVHVRERAIHDLRIHESEQSLAQQSSQIKLLKLEITLLSQERNELLQRIAALSRYTQIVDAEAAARGIAADAEELLQKAQREAEHLRLQASQTAKNTIDQANQKSWATLEQVERRIEAAGQEAAKIIEAARLHADEIAGDAYTAMSRAKEFSSTAQAMKNLIDGYGNAYIVPTYNLLDDLADEFSFTDAGQKLKDARNTSRMMVRSGLAATCDYVEPNRKETAIRFVIDAFNGKVDSILSRSKTDNHGKLEQEIKDAFSLVNHNGMAFRSARITSSYLAARLDELRWAVTAKVLKDEEREEQRRLREQMREEEKARKEYELALKDAAKEEDTLRKAMDKVQKQVAAASEAQRAEFEARLAELQSKLHAAEEKNQRALSMAQQTRSGHVYVISNIGSFGEEVFKIGMTRRLEPQDRIRELGDASVPFEFDVHAMIFSDDAPGLEKSLHRHFLRQQINKVNPRKEFFRLGLEDIRQELEILGVETHWTMTARAHEYRESMRIEQQIIENPEIEREWTRHQLEVEAQIEEEAEVALS
ncbi:DUF4041 domain-containing protein [Pseudomonas sp. PDM16]|uniref:DUF4041 domain-containing protein n=1 Tax=Pseudomonas sp. PDM16 TaxID=2769292 RepID=UPI00177E81AD|nr:DUF4041 domain-containing protein [Pseudomonas sp. PDM16]MBD9412973.1 DUF4041 domain-containing protein [Pseudomonas sp. PDM16]